MHIIIWLIWQLFYWQTEQMNTRYMIPFFSSYGERHWTTQFISCDVNNDNWKQYFIAMDNNLQLLYNLLQNKMDNNDGI